jgi:cytochrome b
MEKLVSALIVLVLIAIAALMAYTVLSGNNLVVV